MKDDPSDEKGIEVATRDTQTTLQSKVYAVPEDMTVVSRSKLEHIKDMAEDSRMGDEKLFNKIIILLSEGLLFSAIGAVFGFATLPTIAKYACIAGIFVGLFLFVYSIIQEVSENNERKKYRNKVAKKIEDIIQQMKP